MMRHEFVERTGFEATADEYREIENEYMEFNGDKDQFCKQWIRERKDMLLIGRRQRQDEIDGLINDNENLRRLLEERDKEIKELKEQLEKENEWKLCTDTGTNMSQDCYEHLTNEKSGSRILTDEEAKQEIYEEFGFDRDAIRIIREVKTYEMNRHYMLRVKDTYEREPVYNATDWNYIRFNVKGLQYEMVNGEMYNYNS